MQQMSPLDGVYLTLQTPNHMKTNVTYMALPRIEFAHAETKHNQNRATKRTGGLYL
jgi:hypothetical protein